jgi:hypothetical protein
MKGSEEKSARLPKRSEERAQFITYTLSKGRKAKLARYEKGES